MIQTFTGLMVDPLVLKPSDIAIEDIAHSLALQCRYMGHCAGFYSVAEHCLYVSAQLRVWGCDAQTRLEGLLHDASEAYLLDVPRPLKQSDVFEQYRKVEAEVESVIAVRFALADPMKRRVREADMTVYDAEQTIIRHHGGHMTPDDAEARFLKTFEQLDSKRDDDTLQ